MAGCTSVLVPVPRELIDLPEMDRYWRHWAAEVALFHGAQILIGPPELLKGSPRADLVSLAYPAATVPAAPLTGG